MADRIFTGYFDTQFYVHLCRADKAEADQIVDTLNNTECSSRDF